MSPSQSLDDGKPSSKPFSLSLSGSSTPNGQSKKTAFNLQPSRGPPPPSRSLARRPHHLHDDESDEEERPPAFETVSGFDTLTGTALAADGRAVDNMKRELVIPVTSKNNWRDRPGTNTRPRGKNLLPKEVQAMQEAEKRGQTVGENHETDRPNMSYGLSFAKPAAVVEEGKAGEDQTMKDAGPLVPPVTDERKPMTQDEIALQALIRESNGDTERRSDLVIESAPGQAGTESGGRYDETGSFRADVASRPESASLDQYNAIPVEEFGAALLRGMGWKEGQSIGRGKYGTSATDDRSQKARIPERRPGFLGIGAKDASGGKGAEAELGAWGKAAMRKGARKAGENQGGEGNTEGVYMPVLMRNKQTGEYITEEELAALKKEARTKKDDDDWRERRDRNLEKSGRDKDRDREHRRRDYDDVDSSDRYGRRRTGASRRERSSSTSDRHSRRRKYEDEDGSARDDLYYRERDRDRDRRDRDWEKERDRDRSRDRSSKHRDDDRYNSRHSSSHTSSRHGRDRDRESDRDSHRRRRRDDR
ncbi:spliceosome ATPase-activating subunit SPP2 [Aspergillus clavatus NRRL 1]|uniref:Pre-mRNA-splicing factor n=1 Tax=Aspergillus clavatus (strain ATCC 1007 / CBS 513.65 / DSM 816 / NCTC 3887 / NRRL 1 / QM 1276 / 107) TaxID=344612 RepID=A1CH65_ASPCL|nr:G-patch domain protein (Spp2), putative [Aspergillus clavatus NRRL 1]EAW10220.1 G-patch domain protein (Spp2), putative [Aspergillus clavatus NRRL 1]